MINTKVGVKTWGESQFTDAPKGPTSQNISATDKAKLGTEPVGDVLNRIADPNWVDPAKKVRAVGSDKMDKDAFMKLMLAQMKHQDPTNPMQSHEMAAQLAQFTSVEQMQNMNSTLTDIKNQAKPTETYQALNFIGKAVAGDSAKISRSKGDTTHAFEYNLPTDAQDVVIKVRNDKGEIVRKVDLKNQKQGENVWTWNGLNEQGLPVSAGEYQLFVEAKDSAGKALAVKTDFDGVITGVNYTPEGPVLLVGTQTVKLRDVKKIVDPRLNQNGQISAGAQNPDLKTQPGVSETNNKAQAIPGAPAADVAKAAPDITEQVGMSSDLLKKVQKELR